MSTYTNQQNFILTYYDDAVKTQVEFRVPLLITLAQAAVESDWGKNIYGNAFFGEKNGKKTRKTKAGNELAFYNTPYDAFKDHACILKIKFPVAFQYRYNADEFIRSVQRDHESRYSDDPLYVQKIISVMALIKILIHELKLNNPSKNKERKR